MEPSKESSVMEEIGNSGDEDSSSDLEILNEEDDFDREPNLPASNDKQEDPEIEEQKDSIKNLRDYQYEIFTNTVQDINNGPNANGEAKNGIVYLETGSGKTVISMMLINYYLAKFDLKKKVIFLANTILLVEQQYKAIKGKLSKVKDLLLMEPSCPFKWNEEFIVDVDFFHGQRGVEESKQNTWLNKFKQVHVMVMTPQVLLNALRRGQIQLSEVKLLIFDECHHAHKDHPYRSILEEFYFRLKSKGKEVPFLYGLTASPIIQNLKMDHEIYDKLKANFIELAKNMDSTYIKYNTSNYEQHRKKSHSDILSYKSIGEWEDQTYNLCINNFEIKGRNMSIELLKEKYKPLGEFYSQIESINEKYTKEFMIDRKLCANFERIFTQSLIVLLNQLGVASISMFLNDFADSDIFSEILDKKEKNKQEINYFTEISREIKVHKDKIKSAYNESELYFSNKFRVLYEKISEQLKDPKRFAVIFVERRFVARYLCDLMKEKARAEKHDWIKPQFLIGFQRHKAQAEKNSSDLDIDNIEKFLSIEQRASLLEKNIKGIDYQFLPSNKTNPVEELYKKDDENNQNNIIKQIKDSKINLIICTSVAEEGFDIPECDMVISFDPVRTLRNYIQHIGRARKSDSKYFLMASEFKKDECEQERSSFEHCLKLIPEVINKIDNKDYEHDKDHRERNKFEYKLVRLDNNSDAMINTNWSVSLLSNYCSALSKDNTYRTRPLYYFASVKEVGHVCYIVLPICKGKERIFSGEWKDKKEEARRSAAMKAVITLKKEDQLTSDLRPKNMEFDDFGDQEEEDDTSQYPIDSVIKSTIITVRKELEVEVEKGRPKVKKTVHENYYPATLRSFFKTERNVNDIRWTLYRLEVLKIDEAFRGLNSDAEFALLHFDSLESANSVIFKYEERNGALFMEMRKENEVVLSTKQYNKLREVHQLLFCTNNRLDLVFYSLKTDSPLSALSFYKEHISRSKKSAKFLEPRSFQDFSCYALLTLIKFDATSEKYTIDWDKIDEIIEYIEENKRIYEFLNAMDKANLKNREERLKLDEKFVEEYKANPFRFNQDIMLQNILDFNKVLVINHGKIGDFNLELIRKSKKKTYKDHKHELLKFFNNKITDDNYIIKYEGATTFMNKLVSNNLMRRGEKKVEIRAKASEEELNQIRPEAFSERAGFTLEFKRFPLFTKTMAIFNILQVFFLHQIRDFFRIRHFRLNILRPLEKRKKAFCLDNFKDMVKGYEYRVPENMVYSQADKVWAFMEANRKICEGAKLSEQSLALIKTNQKLIICEDSADRHKKIEQWFNNILGLTISDNMKDETLKSAMTSKGYSQENNYEYLEFYGDTILKMLATIQVFFECPDAEEGTLHVERNKIINNNFLKSRAVNCHFFDYIIQKLIIFYPNGFDEKITKSSSKAESQGGESDVKQEKDVPYEYQYIPKKVLADVVESLIGLHYDAAKDVQAVHPLQLVQFFLFSLDILKYPVLKLTINDVNDQFNGSPLVQRFKNLEKMIGYSFARKNLLIQAFTHQDFENILVRTVIDDSIDYDRASNDQDNFNSKEGIENYFKKSDSWSKIKAYDFCYERLEFLGDSVLDFLVNERIRNKKTDKAPGKLSLMKQACVNNRSLSIIAMHYDFEHFILMKNPQSLKRILEIKTKSASFIENPNLIPNEINEPLIKALGDIFEAFVGALFLDTGLDIDLTRKILQGMIMEKFIDKFMLDEFVDKQPEAKAQNYLMVKKLMKEKPKIIKVRDEEMELKYCQFKWVFQNPKSGDTIKEIYAKTEEEAKAKFYSQFD